MINEKMTKELTAKDAKKKSHRFTEFLARLSQSSIVRFNIYMYQMQISIKFPILNINFELINGIK
jgi:hypothetical protein